MRMPLLRRRAEQAQLQVMATASLPQAGKPGTPHGSIPPLPEVASSTRVALSTPLRARFPSDFRRDLLRSCLVEQALDCTDPRCAVPLRVQVDVASDDGGVLPAAIHAAALARVNLGHVPRNWPGFSAVSVAGAPLPVNLSKVNLDLCSRILKRTLTTCASVCCCQLLRLWLHLRPFCVCCWRRRCPSEVAGVCCRVRPCERG